MKNHTYQLIRRLLTVAAALAQLLWASSVAQAVPVVTYSVTLDAVLNNPNGTWGGNLLVAANQNLNLTISYQFESFPRSLSLIRSRTEATFWLRGLQVVDNTNGLASDGLSGVDNVRITYNYDGTINDRFTGGAGYATAGGILVPFDAIGEFGDPGDALPSGSAFDAIVNAAGITFIVARATDISHDYVYGPGVFGWGPLDPGTFVFASYAGATFNVIPEPSTVVLMGLGLVGLGYAGRRKLVS